jgi:hypothetical protein
MYDFQKNLNSRSTGAYEQKTLFAFYCTISVTVFDAQTRLLDVEYIKKLLLPPIHITWALV